MPVEFPFADRDELVDDLFGHRVPDPYRWLEDRDDVRTIEWEAAQDYLVEPFLDRLPGREALRERLTRLHHAGSVGAPRWRGERAFFTRREPSAQHAALTLREPDGSERVLIDPAALDATGGTTLDVWAPSIEGARLAYQLSRGGDEESRLHVIDTATGARLDGPIDRCRYSPIAWLPGGDELFYVRRLAPDAVPDGEQQFHRRVYRHRIGTDPADDVEIHGAGLDPTNYYHVSTSNNGRWLLVTASAGTAPRADVWLADLRADGALRGVQIGVDADVKQVDFATDGFLYLATDRGAPRGRVVRIDPERPDYEHWVDAVPEQPDRVLSGFAVLRESAVVAVHGIDATDRVSWWDGQAGVHLGDAAGYEAGSVNALTARPEGGGEAWIGYTDFTAPPSVRQFSLDDPDRLQTWANAPGAAVIDGVAVTQTHCRSKDGAEIHLFILSPSGASGPRPTILYGYGGFNISLTPSYSATQLAWVQSGGVYAIANLRGGSEHGEEWHRAGMRQNKQNVFDDFAAAGDYLVESGWTTRAQLGIFGGSNGGLLVGATITQRPDLGAAAVCSAPLLDMVRYERFGLGRTWSDEYGSADQPDELGWLLGYSPYHHVREGVRYPAVLFTVFDSDTRVDPVHARKMVAALQHASVGGGPILLRREAEVGHGARSVARMVGLAVDQLAFLATELGLTEQEEGM